MQKIFSNLVFIQQLFRRRLVDDADAVANGPKGECHLKLCWSREKDGRDKNKDRKNEHFLNGPLIELALRYFSLHSCGIRTGNGALQVLVPTYLPTLE